MPFIFARISTRPKEQQVLYEAVYEVWRSCVSIPLTKRDIADAWGVKDARSIEKAELRVMGSICGDAWTLVSSESVWDNIRLSLHKANTTFTLMLCLPPQKTPLLEGPKFSPEGEDESRLLLTAIHDARVEQAVTKAAVESLQAELASLKITMHTQLFTASSNLADVLSTLKPSNKALTAQAAELATLKAAYEATKAELIELKSFSKHQTQQLAAYHAREANEPFSQPNALQARARFSKQYVPPSSASSVSGFDVVEADTE